MELDTFSGMIMSHIMEMYPDSVPYKLNENDSAAIQNLADNKYSTWDWNFGYQAKYDFEKLIRTNGGNIEFHLNVIDGIINKCKIFGDYFNTKETSEIEVSLIGAKHEESSIREVLSKFEIDEYFKNVTIDELVLGMF
jgi:lipoate-protein ligase A